MLAEASNFEAMIFEKPTSATQIQQPVFIFELTSPYVCMYVCMYVVYLKLPIQECVHKMCAAAKKFKKVCVRPHKKYAIRKIKRLKIKNYNKT